MTLFFYTTRDTWGRPVRRFDCQALFFALLASAIGTGLIAFAINLPGSQAMKLAARLM
jgi:hypothetical protein